LKTKRAENEKLTLPKGNAPRRKQKQKQRKGDKRLGAERPVLSL